MRIKRERWMMISRRYHPLHPLRESEAILQLLHATFPPPSPQPYAPHPPHPPPPPPKSNGRRLPSTQVFPAGTVGLSSDMGTPCPANPLLACNNPPTFRSWLPGRWCFFASILAFVSSFGGVAFGTDKVLDHPRRTPLGSGDPTRSPSSGLLPFFPAPPYVPASQAGHYGAKFFHGNAATLTGASGPS